MPPTSQQSTQHQYAQHHYAQQGPQPPTPDSERAIGRQIRILQAARAEDGVTGLGGQIAGL
eukprot:63827-Pleurochrysis_carterae.AAC.1